VHRAQSALLLSQFNDGDQDRLNVPEIMMTPTLVEDTYLSGDEGITGNE